jgi:hypothetical protein
VEHSKLFSTYPVLPPGPQGPAGSPGPTPGHQVGFTAAQAAVNQMVATGGTQGTGTGGPSALQQNTQALNRLASQLQLLTRVMGAGGGRGGGGGFGGGGGMFGLPDTPLGRLAHFMHGASTLARGVQGLGGGNPFGLAGALRGGAMLSGAGGALGAVGTAVTMAAAPVAAIAAVVGFTLAIKAAADELIRANHELAKFSPAMAQVFAQRDVQEIFRERDRGNLLADSARQLVREEQRYKDTIFPMETAWEELKNNFLAGFYSELADMADGIRGIAELIGIELKRREQSGGDGSFSGTINRIADEADRRQERARHMARAAGAGFRRGGPIGAFQAAAGASALDAERRGR